MSYSSFLQRVRGRKATSNPTSPLSEPRRQFPEENTHFRDALDAGFQNHEVENHSHKCRSGKGDNNCAHQRIGHIATVRSGRQRNIPNAQGLFDHDHSCSSNSSSYDNIGTGRRKLKVECDSQCPHNTQSCQSTPKTKYKPIGERQIPYSEYEGSSDASESIYVSRSSLQRDQQQQPEPIYQPRSTLQRENLENILFGSKEKIIEEDEPGPIESDYAEIRREARLAPQRQELRQFSREPTCIDLASDTKGVASVTQLQQITTGPSQNNSDYAVICPAPRQFSDPGAAGNTGILKQQKQGNSGNDGLGKTTAQANTKAERTSHLLSPPRKSHSSSSPDWPPPPDSLEDPSSPYSPSANSGFDSCTLRRMLQNLPEVSPSPKNDDRKDNNSAFVYQSAQNASQSGANSRNSCHQPNPAETTKKPVSILRNKTTNYDAKVNLTSNDQSMTHFELKKPSRSVGGP